VSAVVERGESLSRQSRLLYHDFLHPLVVGLTKIIAAAEIENVDGWATAGFEVDFSKDGSGLYRKYSTRGSGYYIDVGFSQLIIDGKINIKQSLEGITGFDQKSLILAEGSTVGWMLISLFCNGVWITCAPLLGISWAIEFRIDARTSGIWMTRGESIAVPDPVLCNSLSLASVWC